MALGTIIGAIPAVSNLISKFVRDPKQALEFEQELSKLIDASDQRQVQLNRDYAKNGGVYMSGWRPLIAWGTSILWLAAHGGPLVFTALGDTETAEALHKMRDGGIDNMILGLLGMAGLRSLDKFNLGKR